MREYIPDKLRHPLRRMKRKILLELDRPTGFNKTDLIHLISKKLKLRNYLELCTPTAGRRYGEIERARFRTARRLMYITMDFDDGMPIDYKIADFDIEDAVAELKLSTDKVDICLVDAFHTYDFTTRDLTCAYELLADGGVLVVHDCSPPNEAWASPTFTSLDWSGESYRSYLDFVLTRDDLDYCTVDVDYGCGLIFKNRTLDMVEPVEPKLVAEWFGVHNDQQLALRFFFKNRAMLLRLISGKNFVRGFSSSIVHPIGVPAGHKLQASQVLN
jgi:SAM-dependent methyltransferase